MRKLTGPENKENNDLNYRDFTASESDDDVNISQVEIFSEFLVFDAVVHCKEIVDLS